MSSGGCCPPGAVKVDDRMAMNDAHAAKAAALGSMLDSRMMFSGRCASGWWGAAMAWALLATRELRGFGATARVARAYGACVCAIACVEMILRVMNSWTTSARKYVPRVFGAYASMGHFIVDASALVAAVASVILGYANDDEGTFAFAEPFIRCALLTRVCTASALWTNANVYTAQGQSARGVFHRLEHAGAVNVAVCVSVAVVLLGPNAGAQHRLGGKMLAHYFNLRSGGGGGGFGLSGIVSNADDERQFLNAVERVEQVAVAALTTSVFNALFNATRRRLLGRPLQSIIDTLEYHAQQVLTDLDFHSTDVQGLDISVLGYVLDKMSHIVKRNNSERGGPALIEAILEDHEDVDGSTREWLVSYEYGGARDNSSSRVSAFKSVVSSFARMGDVGGPYMHVDIEALNSWNFDVFGIDNKDITPYVVRMFHELGLLEVIDVFKLRRFITEVDNIYRDNPYHCFKHAIDVTHTTYLYILMVRESLNMTQLEMFSLLVAALVHDMDHPGVTNAYLIATRDPLAMTYNDESVLENLHLERFFSLCQNNEDANILSGFDDDTYRRVRRSIIACVLHTDMAHHFKLVSRLNEIVALTKTNTTIITGSPIKQNIMCGGGGNQDTDATSISAAAAAASFKTDEERQLMMNIILHCADISNAVKPNALYVKWASRVLEEFFNQGDRERSKGLPISPMMDRESTSTALSQINFMEFVIAPLYVQFAAIFPRTAFLLARLIQNRLYYQEAYERELDENTARDGVERSSEKESFRVRFRTLIEKYSLHRHIGDTTNDTMRAIMELSHSRRGSSGKNSTPVTPVKTPAKRFSEKS